MWAFRYRVLLFHILLFQLASTGISASVCRQHEALRDETCLEEPHPDEQLLTKRSLKQLHQVVSSSSEQFTEEAQTPSEQYSLENCDEEVIQRSLKQLHQVVSLSNLNVHEEAQQGEDSPLSSVTTSQKQQQQLQQRQQLQQPGHPQQQQQQGRQQLPRPREQGAATPAIAPGSQLGSFAMNDTSVPKRLQRLHGLLLQLKAKTTASLPALWVGGNSSRWSLIQVSKVSREGAILMVLVPMLLIFLLILVNAAAHWGQAEGSSVRFQMPRTTVFTDNVERPAPFVQVRAPQQRGSVGERERSTPKGTPKGSTRVSGIAGSATPVQQGRLSLSHDIVRSPLRSSCSTPTATATAASSFAFLCPELVVPVENQCILLLPEIRRQSANDTGILCIDDVNGMPVLYVAYTLAPTPPIGKHEVPGNGKRLIVRSALEDLILASCMDVELDSDTGPASLVILGRSEERRGAIHAGSPTSDTSVVVLWSGVRILIQRCDQAKSTYVVDENGWQMACTRSREPRLLQVNPGADAGLAVLALLGSDLIELGVVNALGQRRM